MLFKVYGKNGKLIEKSSASSHEAEVLFKSGTVFDVKRVFTDKHPLDNNKYITIIELIEKIKI